MSLERIAQRVRLAEADAGKNYGWRMGQIIHYFLPNRPKDHTATMQRQALAPTPHPPQLAALPPAAVGRV